jgi:uncharacterized membrane protein YfcA
MTLFDVSEDSMPSTALALNLVVTSAALLRYGVAGRLRWRVFTPFLVPAIPAAFVGGLIDAPRTIFLAFLAAGLSAAGLAMLRSASRAPSAPAVPGPWKLLGAGALFGVLIGLASGFLGIGGGVFLGPVLLFLHWASPREVAAMNSALILVLSAVGLAAHGTRGVIEIDLVWPLAITVLVGGVAGAHLAETRLSGVTLQRIFAVIVLVAALKAALGAAGV